jgi:hypothetical protein
MYMRGKNSELYGATMSNRMVEDARAFVKRTLKEHQVKPLDKEVVAKGNDIMRSYAKSS